MFTKKSGLSLLLALVLCLSFSVSGFAVTINDLRKKAAQLNEQAKKNTKDTTFVMKNVAYTDDGQEVIVKMTLYYKGNKNRLETEINMPIKTKQTFINDGKNQWLISPKGKTMMNQSSKEEQSEKMRLWINIPASAKIVGEEKIDGRNCYILLFPKKVTQTNKTYNWLDKNTFAWVKVENKKDKTVQKMSDFRKVKGMGEIAYKTKTYEKGKLTGVMTIEKYAVNKGLKDSLFDVKDLPEAKGMGFMGMMDPAAIQAIKEKQEKSKQKKKVKKASKKPKKAKMFKNMFKNKIGF